MPEKTFRCEFATVRPPCQYFPRKLVAKEVLGLKFATVRPPRQYFPRKLVAKEVLGLEFATVRPFECASAARPFFRSIARPFVRPF